MYLSHFFYIEIIRIYKVYNLLVDIPTKGNRIINAVYVLHS